LPQTAQEALVLMVKHAEYQSHQMKLQTNDIGTIALVAKIQLIAVGIGVVVWLVALFT